MISKQLLKKVEAYEITTRAAKGFNAYDVYTLHFNVEWWEFPKTKKIEFDRKTFDIDLDTGAFSHSRSELSTDFHKMLHSHVASTFGVEVTSNKKCPVVSLVPKKEEETEETE